MIKNRFSKNNLIAKVSVILIGILLQVLPQNPLFAQKLIQDSLIISFKPLENINPLKCSIDTIIDQRDESSNVIGICEKTQYLFVPVDLLICTKQPLSTEISKALQQIPKEKRSLRFKLAIDEFKLSKKSNSLFIFSVPSKLRFQGEIPTDVWIESLERYRNRGSQNLRRLYR